MAAELPMHAMKSAAGATVVTRCGFDVKAKGGGWTSWESLVTCAGCVERRSISQQSPSSETRTNPKPIGALMADVFGGD